VLLCGFTAGLVTYFANYINIKYCFCCAARHKRVGAWVNQVLFDNPPDAVVKRGQVCVTNLPTSTSSDDDTPFDKGSTSSQTGMGSERTK
jgi:hypothetical protein